MHTPLTWETESGTIRIHPSRGRVLGLTLNGHDALWSPAETTAAWNLGGERLWIAPEADWFWKKTDKVDFEQYQVPPALDPDEWSITEVGEDTCTAETAIKLICPHADKYLDLALHRRFDLLSPPALTHGGIGLAITTSLTILDGNQGQPVDLWSIMQIPCGGHLLVPTVAAPQPRDYFDPCPAGEFATKKNLFDLRIGGSAMFKVGLAPEVCTNQLNYVRPIGNDWLLLERNFPLHPSRTYCDAPLDALKSQGDAVQFFNDGGKFGNFGEMEHHSPALVCGQGPQTLTETTTTQARLLSPSGYQDWKTNLAG